MACICGDPNCTIPYGLCHCGCGGKTTIATMTAARSGAIKGFPARFVCGHQGVHKRLDLDGALPFKIEGVYCRLIPLTRGQFAIVDATDYEWLRQWPWYANWNPMKHGFYAVCHHATPNGDRLLYMHRLILGLPYGDVREGDHVDPDGSSTDNRRKNLRIATDQEQQRNKRKQRINACGFKGVSFDPKRGKYLACICLNGKTKNLGRRNTAEEAYALYCEAAIRHFGEFARLT